MTFLPFHINKSLIRLIQELYEKYITASIDFILEGLDGQQQGNPLALVLHQTNLNLLVQFCHVFDAMFAPTPVGEEFDPDAFECGFIEVQSFTVHSITNKINDTLLSVFV